MASLSVICLALVGVVSSIPLKPIDQNTDRIYHSLMLAAGSDHKPIFDDETTTTHKPTLPTKPSIPTPMTQYKLETIRKIQQYQRALKKFVSLQTDVLPNEAWKTQSARMNVNDNALNSMSESELHTLLMNIRRFYSATLSNLCCPLGK